MTRPFAGQRNFGSEPSADFPASLDPGASATGVKTLALTAGSASGGAGEGAGFACATAGTDLIGVALDFKADVRTPGITRRSPTLSLAPARMLLALAISWIGLP